MTGRKAGGGPSQKTCRVAENDEKALEEECFYGKKREILYIVGYAAWGGKLLLLPRHGEAAGAESGGGDGSGGSVGDLHVGAYRGGDHRADGASGGGAAERRGEADERSDGERLWRSGRNQDYECTRAGEPVHGAADRRCGGERLPERTDRPGEIYGRQQRMGGVRQRADGREPAVGKGLGCRQCAVAGDEGTRMERGRMVESESRHGGGKFRDL